MPRAVTSSSVWIPRRRTERRYPHAQNGRPRPPVFFELHFPWAVRLILPIRRSTMLTESPVVTVHIPAALRTFVGGHEEIMASGETVGEVLEAIGRECPCFRSAVMQEDGSLVEGLAIYLGPTSVRDLQGLATPVQLEELVSIVPTGELQAVSAAGQGQVRQAGPLDGVEHVLDDQSQLGVAGDLQLTVEEQRVGVLLAGKQLQVGGEIGCKCKVGGAVGPENGTEHAVSIGV